MAFPLRTAVLLLATVALTWGHGRVNDPAGRSTAWRFGYLTPINYDDDGLYCGGFYHQYENNGGKCGLCGDPWEQDPRENEVGGKYATGTIVREYKRGQVMSVDVNITANHKGHFEFKICPNNDVTVEATQDCLDKRPLYPVGSNDWFIWIESHNGLHEVALQLPDDLVCTQCVLQWRYVAGNNWGMCENGTEAVGCGPQEEFRACSDIAIF